jgi:hypothetical protein
VYVCETVCLREREVENKQERMRTCVHMYITQFSSSVSHHYSLLLVPIPDSLSLAQSDIHKPDVSCGFFGDDECVYWIM